MNVLIVDDSRTMRAALGNMIERMGHRALKADGGLQGIEMFQQQSPDLILLDVLMDDMDGYSVARRIRTLGGSEWIPIIFLSAREDDQDLERGIEAGGDDYLVKPVSFVVLNAKIRAMQRIDDMRRRLLKVTNDLAVANRELERMSHFDGLTGIANRRFLDSHLVQEIERAKRTNTSISVILGDIDHFKLFNDYYGHLAGDQCLKQVALAIQSICRRATDLAARYGGEEFAIVLPATDAAGCAVVGQKILENIRDLKIPHAASATTDIVTLSMGGVSMVPGRDIAPADILLAADEMLYRAKNLGRNRYISDFIPVLPA